MAPAGSAPRSPPGSPPRAPRSGSATSTPRAPQRVAGEVNGHAIELDVTDLESAKAAVEAARHARHPRQQRRHRRVRLLHLHDARAVAAGARDQPRRRAQLHPRGAARDAAGQIRPHPQHLLRGRPGRLQGLGRLLGRQGRHRRLHEGDRPRERPLRDHRQLDRPRPDRDAAADGRQGVRRDRREGDRDDEVLDPDGPPRPARRGRRGRRLPGLRRRHLRHRRDPRASAAAWAWSDGRVRRRASSPGSSAATSSRSRRRWSPTSAARSAPACSRPRA